MVFEFFLKIRRKIKRFISGKTNNGKKPHINKGIHYPIKIILVLITISIITFIYPVTSVYQLLEAPQEGEIAPEDIFSPRSFRISKTQQEIEQDKQLIRAREPLVLDYKGEVFNSVMVELRRFFFRVDSLDKAILDDSIRLEQFALRFPELSKESQVTLSHQSNAKAIRKFLITVLADMYQAGLVEKRDNLPLSGRNTVTISKDKKERIIAKEQLLDLSEAEERVLSLAMLEFEESPLLVKVVYDIRGQFLAPNLKANPQETEKRIKEKEESISLYKGSVLKDEKIISKNEKITKEHLEKLKSLAREEYGPGMTSAFLPYMGRVLFIAFVFLFLGLFLYFFKRQIFNSNAKLLMIYLIILLEIVLSFLINFRLGWSEYLIPVAIASLLLTILLDVEVGLLCTLALSLLLGIVHNFDFRLTLITIIVGTLACYGVREVQKRSRFYRPWLYISFAYIIFIFFMEYLRYTPANDILLLCGFGLFNVSFSIGFTLMLLPIFESLFGITTDISLLELSDLNHPVLKRLALEAPGTYHHSIVVGNLAEAAAKDMGANTLLARVGSYYHDIGKLKKPEYFVENQMGAKSKHEKLAPSMSALILESHVKEGVELGEEFNLPDSIIDFIEEHHGTSVMTYFYNKALEQGASEEVKDEFRYPGPKPRSRETAIVMLADAVEAASRTLEDPKPSRIKSLVVKIIMNKFESGELDECPLTLKDLHAAEDSFLPILIGVFHPRIDYPEIGEDVETN